MALAVRRRRTAEEAKALILTTAARRLREHGLEGLNITGVADDAGISHATLIHHFGSSLGMRDALVDQMTTDLLRDMLEALNRKTPAPTLITDLFRALDQGGHAKLLAWQAVESKRKRTDFGEIGKLFEDLLRTSIANLTSASDSVSGQDDSEKTAQELPHEVTQEVTQEVKRMIFLVSTVAIGYGIAGPVLPQLLGMSEDDTANFPAWMAERLTRQDGAERGGGATDDGHQEEQEEK
jgi:AcrR family transcriptional regulator